MDRNCRYGLGIGIEDGINGYCIRIRTRGGIYGQIYPPSEGVPEGEAHGNF